MEENEPVIIQAIMLSDAVIREAGTNKLSLIGTFSQWNVPAFPFTAPMFFVTAFISNFRKGGVTIPLTIRIEDQNKFVAWNMSGKIGFPEGNIPPHAMVEIPVPVQGLTLRSPGRYTVRLLLDGDEIGHRDFVAHSTTGSSSQPPFSPQPPK